MQLMDMSSEQGIKLIALLVLALSCIFSFCVADTSINIFISTTIKFI